MLVLKPSSITSPAVLPEPSLCVIRRTPALSP